tara:strand:- start:414 stop:1154 length:741 start_codon:yes stop_codon:yes gene_type:complete
MPYNKTPFKMTGKSPLMKALVGGQGNLSMELQEAIKNSPAKQDTKQQTDATSGSIFTGSSSPTTRSDGKKQAKQARKDERAGKRSGKKQAKVMEDASPAKRGHGQHSPAKQERELTKAELRAKAARDKRSESQTNKDAAKMENEAARLDLKANKNDRAKARKEKRLATKEETGKTGVGDVISKVLRTGESPNKQAKSKKQMKYEKTAQKAENAVADGKMKKNARLVKKSNKMNKKNNLGNNKIARG